MAARSCGLRGCDNASSTLSGSGLVGLPNSGGVARQPTDYSMNPLRGFSRCVGDSQDVDSLVCSEAWDTLSLGGVQFPGPDGVHRSDPPTPMQSLGLRQSETPGIGERVPRFSLHTEASTGCTPSAPKGRPNKAQPIGLGAGDYPGPSPHKR
jgi:hypothetical protein